MTHAFQFGKRQSWKPDLSSNRKADKTELFLVYRLYLRPNAVPSRWDSVGAPRDFSPEDRRSPAAKLAPCAQSRDGQTGGAGVGGGVGGRRAMEPALERWRNPSLPSQIEISPTPRELAPSSKREQLLPQAEVTEPIAGRSGQGPRTQGTGFQPRLREEESPA